MNSCASNNGFTGLTNSVVAEFDMFYDAVFNDADWTTASIHECTNSVCSAIENPAWSTELVIGGCVSKINN